jgi:hypothetical protein
MLEGVAVARSQLAVVPLDVCEGAEPVVLHLEDPVGMIEWFGEANERHRAERLGRHALTLTAEQYRCQAQPLLN